MKDLLRKHIKRHVVNIIEGLIKTHPIQVAKKILDRKFAVDNLKVKDDISTNRLILDITNFEHFNELLVLINNLGYFVSAIDLYTFGGGFNYEKFSKDKLIEIMSKKKEYKKIELVLEAKFDEQINVSSVLFHVTKKEKIGKIIKNGIVPKSYSKLTHHPDRVHVTSSIIDAKNFINMIKEKDEIYIILGIKTDLVPNIKIYDDPNYKLRGYYILNNVPPNALFFVKEI